MIMITLSFELKICHNDREFTQYLISAVSISKPVIPSRMQFSKQTATKTQSL